MTKNGIPTELRQEVDRLIVNHLKRALGSLLRVRKPLFEESYFAQPKLIIECGALSPLGSCPESTQTQGILGESFYIFHVIAKHFNAIHLSIDRRKCLNPEAGKGYENWTYFQIDDLKFPVSRYASRKCDILYLDSCHEYPHVKQQLINFSPLLGKGSRVFFHDTLHGNLKLQKMT